MKMLIGGEWIDKDEHIDVLDPYNQYLIDTYQRVILKM